MTAFSSTSPYDDKKDIDYKTDKIIKLNQA